MFTGIVTHIATISDLKRDQNQDLLITLELEKNKERNFEIGCSISCNGSCLTLINKEEKGDALSLDFQASQETLDKTTMKSWKVGNKINIEFALKIGDELGGHLVSGHIDGVSKVRDIKNIDESHQFSFEIKEDFKKFICQKGSVTLNGVSLTVNDVSDYYFQVNIIDHTFNNTNFRNLKVGDEVNLEIDQIARYVNNLNSFK